MTEKAKPLSADRSTPTHVAVFCRQITDEFTPRLRRQCIDLRLDVDPDVVVGLPQSLTRRAVKRLVEDAIQSLHDGGQIDVIAVCGRRGIEIEVADTRESSAETAVDWTTDPDLVRAINQGMGLETAACPQGGLARTLMIPWPDEHQRSTKLAA